ncbi:hypothetical protein Bca4012_098682 [Brassica carinata]
MSDHVDGVKRFLKGDESGHLVTIPPLRSVSDVRSNGGWSILPACTNKQLLPHAHLTTIDVSSDSDMTQWKYTANMLKHAFSKLGKEQYMLARAPNIVQENHVRIATLAVIQDLLKDNIDPRPTCTEVGTMMSSRSKAWLVAATIGAVEASKDQLGLCRWNYMIRSVNQRIRNNVRSATQANRFSSSSTTVVASGKDGDTAKKAEESLRTVMYLSCWGPN